MDHLLSSRGRSLSSSTIRDLLRLVERPGVASLAGGLPAGDLLPVERLREATDRALSTPGRYGPPALQYGPTEGSDVARGAIAAHVAAAGATAVDPDHVVVTTGSQQALDLLARTLLDPGDAVVVEDPGYLGARQALALPGVRPVPVGVDADGLRTDVLEHHLRAGLRPKACVVVPSFQNPTGATLSAARRRHLVALADHFGFLVVADDPYVELRWEGAAPPPLGPHLGPVVALGSTSKLLAPGLRVGWAIVPSWLHGPLVRAKQAADLHTATLAQLVVTDLLTDTTFVDDHRRRLRTAYRRRSATLQAALPPALEADAPAGGFFLWARAPGVDTAALLPDAVDRGVAYVPGVAFAASDADGPHSPARAAESRGTGDRLRLSFASLPEPELRVAADRLAAVLAWDHGRRWTSAPPSPAPGRRASASTPSSPCSASPGGSGGSTRPSCSSGRG